MIRVVAIIFAGLVASAGTARAGEHRVFSLIVTNNNSFELGRPNLQYADDDGAKYYTSFRALTGTGNLRLLTDFDRDTARLFPGLVAIARPPTKRELAQAAADLATEIASAAKSGATTDFYFIYAGHGDVDGGRGFLELADARLYSHDLEALLAKIPATHIHVILDSCNSFFVINARKPGGRRFATPKDATESLTRRLPNVGVFLSTSAEAEVFEWSELQSGVFSHAVRSGLAGAADANGDGMIDYAELRGFVDIAAANIRNAGFRPKVFARGPGGDDKAPVLARTTKGVQLKVGAQQARRLVVRDRDELPWVDVFAEAGAPVTLHLPPELADATIDELAIEDAGTRVVRRSRLGGDPTAIIALADLPVEQPAETGRGASQLFRGLFTKPYGPVALAAYNTERAATPEPVFGVSRDDAERMELLLEEIGHGYRAQRIQMSELMIGGGLVVGAFSLDPDLSRRLRVEIASVGSLLAVAGVIGLVRRSWPEQIRETFVRGLRRRGDHAQVVAATDARLHALAARSAQMRRLSLVFGSITLASSAALAAITYSSRRDEDRFRGETTLLYGLAGFLGFCGGALLVTGQFEAPIERAVRLWDGAVRRTQLGIVPTTGGAALSVGGSF